MRERRPAERVVGGREDEADLLGLEREPARGLEGEPEELLLGRLGAALEARRERLRVQLKVALLHTGTGEDRLREGVGGQAEQGQKLVLREGGRGGGDGRPAQPGEGRIAVLSGYGSEGGFRHPRNYRDGRAASQACETAA